MISPAKILIIQTAFIGDVILALPLVQVLKKNYPDTAVDFLCIPSTSELLKNNPYVNEVIVYDKRNSGMGDLLKLGNMLKEKHYDAVISPHRSFRSSMLAKLSSAGKTISFSRSSMSFIYDERIMYRADVHEIQRNLSLLAPLGIAESGIIRPKLFPGDEEKRAVDEVLSEAKIVPGDRMIIIAPGSVWFTKRYPEEKFAKVCDMLAGKGLKIMLTGSKNDLEFCEYIRSDTTNENVHNAAGKLSILAAAELISRAEVLLTNDSSPLHLANAVNTRVVALFGSTVPSFGFFPYNENDIILEINNLPCRPCTDHGRQSCPIKTFLCMNDITGKSVVESILKGIN